MTFPCRSVGTEEGAYGSKVRSVKRRYAGGTVSTYALVKSISLPMFAPHGSQAQDTEMPGRIPIESRADTEPEPFSADTGRCLAPHDARTMRSLLHPAATVLFPHPRVS